jgi:hypothetical protein
VEVEAEDGDVEGLVSHLYDAVHFSWCGDEMRGREGGRGERTNGMLG